MFRFINLKAEGCLVSIFFCQAVKKEKSNALVFIIFFKWSLLGTIQWLWSDIFPLDLSGVM